MEKSKTDNYEWWAGPRGREIATRIKKYKRHIVFLYGIIGVLMVAAATLAHYFYKFVNGGYGV